jgi:O-antigen/teichoic acid export membrane protein
MLRNNILLSGMLKFVGLATSFLIVPVTLHYLDNEPYGIWMTISSMAFWIFTFDIGLGNGLRNYLTATISKGDFRTGGVYVSSTFAMLSVIAVIIGLLSIPFITVLDFNRILNTSSLSNDYLRFVFFVAIFLTLINFVVKNIGFIYVSLQQYAINDLLTVGGNVLALFVIFLLTKLTDGSLLYVVIALMAMPVLMFVLGGIPLFVKYPELRPSYKKIDINFNKDVVKKGMGFFVIQITSCLVIFGGSNFFISHFSGPAAVTTYNIAYKYFNLLVIGFTVFIAPLWNAYTDAYVKGDWSWIKRTFFKTLMVWGVMIGAGVVMLFCCNLFYQLWVGEKVLVPFFVSVSVLVYVAFFNLNNCVTYLLNGLNIIRVQICCSVVVTVLYLLVVTLLGKSLGIVGVVLCMASSYAVMGIIHLYQCWLIITQKAKGIWIK